MINTVFSPSFLNWINFFNLITIIWMIIFSFLIAAIVYSGRVWKNSNNDLTRAINNLGQMWTTSSDKLSSTVEEVGQSLEHVVSELSKDTEKVTDKLVAGNDELIKEIQQNRNAIRNFRDMFWWLPKTE